MSLYQCRGFSSIGFACGAATEAKRLNPSELIVMYVGDFDFDGRNIDKALLRELRLHVADQFPIVEQRIAAHADQVAEFELPTRPDRTGAASVQAEALPPVLMRRLLRDAILKYLRRASWSKPSVRPRRALIACAQRLFPMGNKALRSRLSSSHNVTRSPSRRRFSAGRVVS